MTHHLHGTGGRTNKNDSGFFAGLNETGIFGQEAIARMNGITAGTDGCINYFPNIQVSIGQS